MTSEGASDDADADPHRHQPIETAGAPVAASDAAVVFLHGRGGTAGGMLALADDLRFRTATHIAPQAAKSRWYPNSGYAPTERNQPWIDSALGVVSRALAMAEAAEVPPERTVLVGFSQGASIAAEFVARYPRQYGGLVVLSGGLLGADPERALGGSIDGTPVYVGYGGDDATLSEDRIAATVRCFEALEGEVEQECHDGLGHAIDDAELRTIDRFLDRLR